MTREEAAEEGRAFGSAGGGAAGGRVVGAGGDGAVVGGAVRVLAVVEAVDCVDEVVRGVADVRAAVEVDGH